MTYFIVFCHHIINPNVFEVHLLRKDCVSILSGSAAIFFAYYFFTFDWFRSSRLVSIEGDRRLEESSAQHANAYLRSRRRYVEDVYWVCLRSIRMDGTYTYGV